MTRDYFQTTAGSSRSSPVSYRRALNLEMSMVSSMPVRWLATRMAILGATMKPWPENPQTL